MRAFRWWYLLQEQGGKESMKVTSDKHSSQYRCLSFVRIWDTLMTLYVEIITMTMGLDCSVAVFLLQLVHEYWCRICNFAIIHKGNYERSNCSCYNSEFHAIHNHQVTNSINLLLCIRYHNSIEVIISSVCVLYPPSSAPVYVLVYNK